MQAGQPLVVASRAIKYGEKVQPAMLTVIRVPATAVPDGSFTTVAQVMAADHGGPPVALFPMASHEALLPAKLSGPGARASVAAEIAEGMRAYALKVTDSTGVAGHALPGDHVDVVLLRDLTPSGDQRNYISYVVVQNARVLGVNLNADLSSDKPARPDTYTIEVSVEDSQKLSVAATLGTLSLALRRTGASEVEDAPPLRTNDFLVGGGAARGGATLTRTSAPRGGGGGAVARHAFSAILIIEGEPAKHGGRRKAAPAAAPAPSPNGATAGAATPPGTAGLNAIG